MQMILKNKKKTFSLKPSQNHLILEKDGGKSYVEELNLSKNISSSHIVRSLTTINMQCLPH